MIPALSLAAALALAPAHRVADFRAGATTADERLLAIDQTHAVTFRAQDNTIRVVPFDGVSKATTIVTGVNATRRYPVAAPPLVAWTGDDQTARIAPIDAPDRAVAVRGDEVQTMNCNASACLATMTAELQLLHLDATPYAHVPQGGAKVLASDPEGFLVFRAPSTLMRVDNGGAISFSLTTPSLACATADFDGTRYAVVWPEYDFPSRTTKLRAMAVRIDGDAAPLPDLASLNAAINDSISIAYNAGQHLLVFADADPDFALVLPGAVPPSHLAALRLDAALHPLDTAPIVVDATPWAVLQPVVIGRGSGFLTAWSHSPGLFFTSDPEAATVDADGHVSPRVLLSQGSVPQDVSSAATVPGAMLVGYLEMPHQDGVPTLRVARFALDGAPLGDVVVAAADAHASAMSPRGSDVLVAWTDAGFHAKAAILRGDNTLQPVALPALSGNEVSAAANAHGWMLTVAGTDGVNAIRIDANGVAAAPQSIVSIPNTIFDAAVASDGDRFLVVWGSDGGSGSAACNFVPCGTRAALLDATGGTIDDRIALSSSRDVGGVAFAGGEYFVATTTAVRLDRNGERVGTNPPVRYTRVAPFGSEVLAVREDIDATHVVAIDHGTVVADAALPQTRVEITTAGVAYDVDVNGLSAVVFQMFAPSRRRAAAH